MSTDCVTYKQSRGFKSLYLSQYPDPKFTFSPEFPYFSGLNAIQSYVAWDMHEPRKGTYNFRGRMDIVRLAVGFAVGLFVSEITK